MRIAYQSEGICIPTFFVTFYCSRLPGWDGVALYYGGTKGRDPMSATKEFLLDCQLTEEEAASILERADYQLELLSNMIWAAGSTDVEKESNVPFYIPSAEGVAYLEQCIKQMSYRLEEIKAAMG